MIDHRKKSGDPAPGKAPRVRTRASRLPVKGGPPEKLSQKAKQSLATQARILDAAEHLFARRGFYGVTLRDVAQASASDTALLHYHFGDKQGLFDEVFARRTRVLNEERISCLDRYAAENAGALTVEGAIAAFLQPIFNHSRAGDPGWKNYFKLVAIANNTSEWGGETMTRFFDPVIERLIEILRKALPEAAEADLYWCFEMFSGALTLLDAETGRIDRLSKGACHSGDVDAIEWRIINYTAAGFRSVAAQAR